jgi:small subunit ribosomal protein S9
VVAAAAWGPFALGSGNPSALQQLLAPSCSKPATLRHFSSQGGGGGGFRRGGPGSADRNNRGRGEGNRGNNNNNNGGGGGWGFIGERNTRGGGGGGNSRGGSSRDTAAPSWLSGTTPSSSSSPPPRLRRPLRFGDPSSAGQYPPGSSPIGLDAAQRRPHLVALFPGDYSDDPGNDEWDNDDDFGDDEEEDNESSSRLEAALRRNELELQRKRERWIENSIPPVWTSLVDDRGRSYGRGGRKRAQARVWIQPGFGTVTVNRRHFEEYFTRMSDRDLCLQPMVATATLGHFDVTAIVQGGGLTGQAGAIRHGVARALNAFDPDRYRADLKVLGLLTRDARKVERKKIGHKKARKSPQWVRR